MSGAAVVQSTSKRSNSIVNWPRPFVIERNAVAAARALDANSYANLSDGHHMISYDRVVEVMKETGKDIPSLYRETSEGGLARNYTQK